MNGASGVRRRSTRRGWVRPAALCAALAVVGVVTVVAAQGFGGRSGDGDPQPATGPATTVQVTRETLRNEVSVAGRLDFGTAVPVSVPRAGTVTWLPRVGTPVSRGEALLRVDEQSVVLLYGSVPMFRPLGKGAKGRDVTQLERNLRALGYSGFTVDGTYSAQTTAAVKRWQKWMGRPTTGVVQPGDVAYASGPIRVARHLTRVGAQANADVLTYTTRKKVVTVDAEADEIEWAEKGREVTVALPNGETVTGTVASIGAEATAPPAEDAAAPTPGGGSGTPDATVAVTITIADQKALRDYQRSPVDIRYVAQERADILTVPVAALLALAEGGYGVEIVTNGSTQIVPVEVGMFANARVEVSAPELAEGIRVGVAS